jgi:spore coat protein U-like protein
LISSRTAENIHSQIYHKHSLTNLKGAIMMKYSNVVKSALSAAALGFLALGLASTSAFAGTATTTFNVTATVANICTVSATTLAFGTVPATGAQNTSTITVTCTPSDAYSVALTAGGGTSETARFMKGVTTNNHLSYALTETTYSGANWGTSAGAVTGTGNGAAQPLTVYGTITAAQALVAPVDTYSDTITVNVTF